MGNDYSRLLKNLYFFIKAAIVSIFILKWIKSLCVRKKVSLIVTCREL